MNDCSPIGISGGFGGSGSLGASSISDGLDLMKDKSRPTFSPPHPVDSGKSGSIVVEAAARQLALANERGQVLEKKRKFTFSPILPAPATILQSVRTVSQSAPCSPKHFSEFHF